MRESYYTAHASHALRFFAKNQDKLNHMDFRSAAEMMDWNACKQSIIQFPEDQRKMLLEVYREDGFKFRDKVKAVAQRNEVTEKYLWVLVDALMKMFARNRGLI